MRIILTLLLHLTINSEVFGQKSCEICKLSTKKIDTVPLATFKASFNASNHVDLSFVDCRADTNKIGYRENNGLRRPGKEDESNFFPYQLEFGTANGLAQLLSNSIYLPDQKSIRLTGFIKVFWIYEYHAVKEEKGFEKNARKRNRLVFKADYFLERDNQLYPFVRIDTVILDKSVSLTNDEHVIQQLVSIHTNVFAKVDIAKVISKKSYTKEFIKEKNVLSEYPILSNKTEYKKGIYRSYEEFLTNSPSIVLKDVLVQKNTIMPRPENDEDVVEVSKNIWGFSNEGKIYITIGNNFFELVKVGHTFELIGYTFLSDKKNYLPPITTHNQVLSQLPLVGVATIAASSLLQSARQFSRYFFPMQIDIEKGTIY